MIFFHIMKRIISLLKVTYVYIMFYLITVGLRVAIQNYSI